ncbi:hypothetical protein C8R43DRAFT_1033337 [Mycena crocata]|nr:hypothetical protein C8R43DRAFT_1033337 [Mycena crocata]
MGYVTARAASDLSRLTLAILLQVVALCSHAVSGHKGKKDNGERRQRKWHPCVLRIKCVSCVTVPPTFIQPQLPCRIAICRIQQGMAYSPLTSPAYLATVLP